MRLTRLTFFFLKRVIQSSTDGMYCCKKRTLRPLFIFDLSEKPVSELKLNLSKFQNERTKHQVRDPITHASDEEDFNAVARLAFRQQGRFPKETLHKVGLPQDRAQGSRLKLTVADARAGFMKFI